MASPFDCLNNCFEFKVTHDGAENDKVTTIPGMFVYQHRSRKVEVLIG